MTSSEEADITQRGRIAEALGPFEAYAEALPGYAGLYLDQAAGGMVVLASALPVPPEGVRELQRLLPRGATMRLRTVRHSSADIQSIRTSIRQEIEAGTQLGSLLHSVGTNLPDNVVEVGTLPQNVAFVSESLGARFGDAIVVQGSQPDQLTACTRTDCVQQPWRGGLKIYPEANPGGYCSSAFAVYSPATGNIFLLTAGHCLRVGDKWKHSTATLGRATRESFYDGSNADAGLIDINNDWGGYYVFQSSSIPNRSIWSAQNIYDDRVGQPVNKSATTTGFTMGHILDIDYDAYYPRYDVWIENQRRADYSVEEHDSGGSVYFNTLAMGIQSGVRTNGQACTPRSRAQSLTWTFGCAWWGRRAELDGGSPMAAPSAREHSEGNHPA